YLPSWCHFSSSSISLSSLISFFSFFFFYCSPDPRVLHSFPTRRSSDLASDGFGSRIVGAGDFSGDLQNDVLWQREDGTLLVWTRSEEHTSELQSRFDLVCRLLLEKKKNKKK